MIKKLIKNLHVNVGAKLCKIARFLGGFGLFAVVIGLIVSLIGVFVALAENDFISLIVDISCVAGGLLFIISSLFLYAFGQITDDVHAIKEHPNNMATVAVNDLPEL